MIINTIPELKKLSDSEKL